ncbi:MAG TPA: DUF6687 family protein [Pyrinomonadaceae bacterium]|nr:DUF6687 family protein [Pyrinomonadaceae bacterium]
MRFEFYTDALENTPKLSVDGTVPNSIHFSHWEGNETPAELKADTSTEIALNLVASPNRDLFTKGIDLVTNNHFDCDGVLSVWTMLNGERALPYRDLLIDAAEAGDFSEHSSDDGVRVSIAIQGAEQSSPNNDDGSPLAQMLAGREMATRQVDNDALSYELLLPEVERLLTDVNAYEPLWRDGWKAVADALESFESGRSQVRIYEDSGISVVTLAPEIFSGGGFSPTRHSAPFTAISKYARGELFLIGIPTEGGWFYRLDYPYYSWAETVVRPRIARRDLAAALQSLNEREASGNGSWKTDNREMTSAVKFLDGSGSLAPSGLGPDEVLEALTKNKEQSTKLQQHA